MHGVIYLFDCEFVIWFFWIEAEPLGVWPIEVATILMDENHPLRLHLIERAAYMRPITMGLVFLFVLAIGI